MRRSPDSPTEMSKKQDQNSGHLSIHLLRRTDDELLDARFLHNICRGRFLFGLRSLRLSALRTLSIRASPLTILLCGIQRPPTCVAEGGLDSHCTVFRRMPSAKLISVEAQVGSVET